MIRAPFNNIIVKIDVKYLQHFGTMIKVANMNYASQINPADYINVVGDVVSLPKQIIKREDYKGFSTKDIQIGDKLLFRYDVIWEFMDYVNGEEVKFKNLFWYDGSEYWICNIQKAFAVIRGNDIIMLNGYCMVQDIQESAKIYLPNRFLQSSKVSKATVVGINDNLIHLNKVEVNVGDKIYFKSNRVQNYNVKNKSFGIITQKDIFCKEIEV